MKFRSITVHAKSLRQSVTKSMKNMVHFEAFSPFFHCVTVSQQENGALRHKPTSLTIAHQRAYRTGDLLSRGERRMSHSPSLLFSLFLATLTGERLMETRDVTHTLSTRRQAA